MRALITTAGGTTELVARHRLALIAVWLAVAFVLVLRAGFYPAIMTGDEVWFSESAFQFLHHGIPQRLIHADAVGSASADFLPPIVMLVQALSFSLFGLTPFAVAFQSVAAPLTVMLLVSLIARRLGASTLWAGLAGVAVLGSQVFLHAGLYIRYEAVVAVCFLGYLAATLSAPTAVRPHINRGIAGFCLALAGLAYYPLAPFIGIAAVVVELARLDWRRRDQFLALHPLAAGFLVPAALFGAYVAAHPAEFALQVLSNGQSNYFTFELPARLFDLDFWRGSRDAVPELAGLALFFTAGWWRLGRQSPLIRALFHAAAITALPALIYPFQSRLLAVPVTLVLILVALWAEQAGPVWRPVARAALVGGAGAAALSGLLLAVTVLVQHTGRSYGWVSARLDRMLIGDGPVAIDQRAWLALRARDPDRELHQLMPGWAPPQVRVFQSRILGDPGQGSHFEYVVVNAADAADTIARTPALAAAFAQRKFMEIGRIRPAFQKLPWAEEPPYDLIVYARRDLVPPATAEANAAPALLPGDPGNGIAASSSDTL